MLPVVDAQGRRTGRHAVCFTFGLLLVSFCPVLFKLTGSLYLFGAVILGLGFLWFAIQFSRHLTVPRARQLFYASILYLPLLLAVMVLDKIR
jgi:protoheme IX farnesyltransferase